MTGPRYTTLRDCHEALGATFTDFGGWMMPVRYSSDLAEHHAVRTAAGLFDISHMAEFTVEGTGAGELLDYALAGRLSTMAVGKAKYSLVLAESGGIVDDVIVYRLAETRFLVIANAGNRDAVAEALAERADTVRSRRAGLDLAVADVTDDYALVAVQGPAARGILESVDGISDLDRPLSELPYYAAASGRFRERPLLVARTGYTGEDGFELLVPTDAAAELWDALLAAGEPAGLMPAGLAARDTLRLEAGMPLYGHELSPDIVPAQAGLGRVVAADKPDFVGKAGLGAVIAGAAPVLVGLIGEGRRAGRAGYAVHLAEDDTPVGEITSGALSPTLGHPIAMAYVAPSAATPGTALTIDVRGTRLPVTVTDLPFYRRTN
ncbi:glycine cleavage system aminomethyltransferase GcvT [Microbacterium sp. zg.Y1084]|uniref:glycine cleavage system aminomethyltransferase GcvT n=1 Tax=Microbacterium sp. zg.Y1084 TaxID=2969667 RepID=UPI00214ABE4E|nr:glycine cleavage system aminomethyltransferase GcvT [Microbacterium sp. zg.Y1084]MCR2812103.1 glycine cleavage system aminomethyltransferase GcvT [Microbacterium sp. zg.Y1084]